MQPISLGGGVGFWSGAHLQEGVNIHWTYGCSPARHGSMDDYGWCWYHVRGVGLCGCAPVEERVLVHLESVIDTS